MEGGAKFQVILFIYYTRRNCMLLYYTVYPETECDYL